METDRVREEGVRRIVKLLIRSKRETSKRGTRSKSGAKSELWCSFLVPIALLCTNYYISGIHIAMGVLSCCILIVLFCKAVYPDYEIVPQMNLNMYYLSCIVGAITIWKLTSFNMSVIALSMFSTFRIFELLYKALLLSYSFAKGEAAVVSQSVTLFIISCHLSSQEIKKSAAVFPEGVQFTQFAQVLLLGCLFLIFLLYQYPFLRSTVEFYSTCVVMAIGMIILWIIYMKQNPITWLFYTCISSSTRMLLILLWVALVTAAVAFTAHHTVTAQKPASTLARKCFHIIIITIYLPGLLFDIKFLYLASVVALSIFLLLEACRVFRIPPLGTVIGHAFSSFADEKDSGILVLSNIYLLVGCSCPLWLYPPHHGLHVSHWSGIISVGLGDMVAAAAGTAFGKHKWSGSNKTFEGTICASIAQVIALFIILYVGHIFTSWNIGIVVLASVATSILEAKTTLVDNLILPLFMFSILSFVKQ